MAEAKISDLPAATTPLAGTELLEMVQGGASKKVTVSDISGTATLQGTMTSYQNSAMSAAVDAYVFKDSNGNITRVYEPLRNNDVSRNQFAYADSIDKTPFDNTEWFNNRFIDIKLVGVDNELTIIQGCSLEKMVIKSEQQSNREIVGVDTVAKTFSIAGDFSGSYPANNSYIRIIGGDNAGKYSVSSATFDGVNTNIVVNENVPSNSISGVLSKLQLINCSWYGKYGNNTPNDAELYITGYGVLFDACDIRGGRGLDNANPAYFDLVGDSSVIEGTPVETATSFLFNNFRGTIVDDIFQSWCAVTFNANATIVDCFFEADSGITLNGSVVINISKFGISTSVSTTENITDKQYVRLGGSTCLLGISGGNVTATAV